MPSLKRSSQHVKFFFVSSASGRNRRHAGRCFPVQPLILLEHAFIIPSAHKTETSHKDVKIFCLADEARKQRWQQKFYCGKLHLTFIWNQTLARKNRNLELKLNICFMVYWLWKLLRARVWVFSFAHSLLLFRSLPVCRTSEKKIVGKELHVKWLRKQFKAENKSRRWESRGGVRQWHEV